MRPYRIALEGFGRVGRNLFRILHGSDELEIVAINDPADPSALEYLLKFDTIHGRFAAPVAVEDGHLFSDGRRIPLLPGSAAGTVDWRSLGVDVVVEATAKPRTRAEYELHLEAGARRVILCAPPQDPPDLTLVTGVNDAALRPEHRIVSNASCTAHAAAPVLAILDRAFGIERAFVTTVHAYSNQGRLADVPSADPRRGRAAAENIIPQESNAGEVLQELLPALAGRISAKSINVPVANGSVVDLVCWHRDPVTVGAINQVVRTAAGSRYVGILAYEDQPIVSSDIIRSAFSGTFDADATLTLGDRMSKTLTWFDNGWGYAHRVVDLLKRFRAFDSAEVAS
jgi:glyceraldehyde 3-phosphate dehydrogenase